MATDEHEQSYDVARVELTERYCEVLTAEGAPKYQRAAPRTLNESLARPDASRWRDACHENLASLTAKGVATLMTLSSGKRYIPLRWVFTYKLRPDGHIERYKARLVAQEFTHQHGVAFFEVRAPTGRLAACRVLLAHAAYPRSSFS
jgi:hypothetical protein